MKSLRILSISICLTVLGVFEAMAQEQKVKVDPGVSVHNYKHPNKAAKARKMQEVRPRRFRSRVGIVRHSTNAPLPQEQHETPKYARRSGWLFFKRTSTPATKLNPLTNPGNYKTNMVK
jgi:hypothetical protein